MLVEGPTILYTGAFCGMPVEFRHILFERCPALRSDGQKYRMLLANDVVSQLVHAHVFFLFVSARKVSPSSCALCAPVAEHCQG